MDISFMSFSLLADRAKHLIDADTMAAAAAENGFTKMDMMSHEFELYGADDLEAAMEKYGVHCDCVIAHIPFFTEHEEEIAARIEESLELAAGFGNKIIMIVPGINDDSGWQIRSVMN